MKDFLANAHPEYVRCSQPLRSVRVILIARRLAPPAPVDIQYTSV